MARVAGQVDEAKTQAILDAALVLFAEKGALASMEAIARRAGVSRQTLYNRFPSKVDIGQALASRRAQALTEPLRTGGEPRAVLAGYAEGLLHKMRGDTGPDALRGVALMSPTAPELAEAVYRAGPAEGLRQLSAWLSEQDRTGRLTVPDPDAAAEMYAGMIMGHGHLRMILNLEHPPFDVQARANETAERFIRAFTPA
ncbi:TetR/AcrR family transcriptional regulator [Brevundimonas sp.]